MLNKDHKSTSIVLLPLFFLFFFFFLFAYCAFQHPPAPTPVFRLLP